MTNRPRFFARPLAFAAAAAAAAAAGWLGGIARADEGAPDLEPVKAWIEKASQIDTAVIEFEQEREMRNVKRPLLSTGKLWYVAPGTFRWESGDPPRLVSVRREGADFVVARPQKKSAERFKTEDLRESAEGRGLAFIEAGFPKSVEDFQKTFEIRSVEKDESGHYWQVEAGFRDRKAATAVRKIVFTIAEAQDTLAAIELFFREGSRIFTRLTKLQTGAKIDSSVFEFDLSGYKVEEAKPKG